MTEAHKPTGNALQLTLATGAFAVCFAIFGSVSAMMPIIKKNLHLDPVQVSVALALPVLLGSLGRIPLGMMADRFGGRVVFSAIMACSIVPAVFMGWLSSYSQLLTFGFLIGSALASFSVGVSFVSRWYPPERQGTALGIYGAGNIGQSLAAFGAPVVAAAWGFRWGFWLFGILTLVWLLFFIAKAENPVGTRPKSFADTIAPLKEKKSWVLSLYYFLTFGGFVAMSVYLPTLLTDIFKLTPQNAGLRTAGFVVLATTLRPVGGKLADRLGGNRILYFVFPLTAAMALLLAAPPHMITFTIGALGMAAAIGLGNGAVFKLVPQFFPNTVGSVTGLVGAAGGLGGFFPPLVLGIIRKETGTFSTGFVLLAAFALFCLLVLWLSGRSESRERESQVERMAA
jgi:MFS transporter, NNP family, nitrate/nitrite transporter